MRVVHPIARREAGVVDDYVDVRGRSVPVDDDGTFEVPDDARSWLERWAAGYGVNPEGVIVDEPSVWAESLADEHWQTVVSEVESGEVDDLLDDLEAVDDRDSVQQAIADRRETLEN